MKRLLPVLLIVCLVTGSAGCGKVFVRGALGSGMVQTASGFVSVVQLMVVDGNVTVTFVTLLQNGTASSVNFCGDQRSQFPMNQFVTAQFTPGLACANIVVIVIG